MADINERIKALDDKDAIYVAQQLVCEVFPSLQGLEPEAEIPTLLTHVAEGLGQRLGPPADGWEEKDISAQDAGELARELLLTLAAGGSDAEQLVEAAIDAFPSTDLDLGALTVPIAAALLILVVTGGIKIEFRGFSYTKKPLTPTQQIEGLRRFPMILSSIFLAKD